MSFDKILHPNLALAGSVQQLRQLPREKLTALCEDLRRYLLNSVSQSSGHFASGLGVVELSVALHYVYITPFDQLIWDVGHQAYPHKILTGRRDQIATIRQKDGLHPFPWRQESEFDVMSVGHSSTSISAAVGLSVAAAKEQLGRRVACVIGDGAITAGMAFEAMNHAGDIKPDMLVILNDNDMSISENVGALNNRIAQLLTGKTFNKLRENGKRALTGFPPIKELLRRTEEHIKGMVSPGTLFTELGFNYIGPVDGHDVHTLITTLNNMRELKGPQFLHIITRKGKGYAPAEKDPITWHAVPKFDPASGLLPASKKPELPSYSKIFGDWLCDAAAQDPKLMAITPAMREGSGMVRFSKLYPDNYFDVAIAEQHAVTFAAGLAIGGYHPVVAIYSTFLQRAYDQLIHDVAIQKLPVLFAIDRGGIVGADGQTHQGAFDIAFLRCIPDLVIMTPSDENECRLMLHTGHHYQLGPCTVRYPRGSGPGAMLQTLTEIPIGKSVQKRQGEHLAILNFGALLAEAEIVAEKLNATLIDMRFVKPLDMEQIMQLASTHSEFVTLEEGAIQGGAGSAVNECLMAKRKMRPVLNIGLPDFFIPQGTQEEIYHALSLDAAGILQQIERWRKV